MTINPDAPRIGHAPVRSTRRAEARDRQPEGAPQEDAFIPPRRAETNFIPSPESLQTLIRSAIAALRKGIYWDRGTILNILT